MSAAPGAVVVTGSSTGIGRACALGLDRKGFEVFAGVRRAEDGDALAAAASDRLRPLILDVTDAETISAAERTVREATGGRLAGLVNNAGISVAGPVEAVPLDQLRRQLEVNVTAQVAVTQALLPMIRAARGRVVFISSIGSRGGVPFLSPYNASKAAISAIGDSLRQELAPLGVEVSVVEPGAIATEIWGKGTEQGGRVRDAMEPELAELYAPGMDQLTAMAEKMGAAGLSPDAVFDVVEHALTAPKPKAVYVVGRDAKIQGVVRSVLPRRAVDRLIRRQLGSG